MGHWHPKCLRIEHGGRNICQWLQSYFAGGCHKSCYEKTDYLSFIAWPIKPPQYAKVLHLCNCNLLTKVFIYLFIYIFFPLWMFFRNFSTKGESKVWHHLIQSWKVMAKTVAYLSRDLFVDIVQFNLWWTRIKYQGLYFGSPIRRVYTLYGK